MNKYNQKIARTINTEERLFKIIDSMRGIESSSIVLEKDTFPDPELNIILVAKNGIMDYQFKYSGASGMNEFVKKYNTHIIEATERGGAKYTPKWEKYEEIVRTNDMSLSQEDLDVIITNYLMNEGDPLLNVPSYINLIQSHIEKGMDINMISDLLAIPASLIEVIKREDKNINYFALDPYILILDAQKNLAPANTSFSTNHSSLISAGFKEIIPHNYILEDDLGKICSLGVDEGNNNASLTYGVDEGKKAIVASSIPSLIDNSKEESIELSQKPN